MRARNRKGFKESVSRTFPAKDGSLIKVVTRHKENLQKRASMKGKGAGNMKGEYLWWIKDQFQALLKSGRVQPSEESLFIRVKQEQRRIELITSTLPSRNERGQTPRLHQRSRLNFGHPTPSSQSISRGGSYDDFGAFQAPTSSIFMPGRSETPSSQHSYSRTSRHSPILSLNAMVAPLGRVQAPMFSTPNATNLVRHIGDHGSGVTVKRESGSFEITQPRVTDQEIQSFIQSTIDSSSLPESSSKKRTASEEVDPTISYRAAKRTAIETDLGALIPGYEDMLAERARKEAEIVQLENDKQERLKKRAQKAEEKSRQESIAAFERETKQANHRHSKALRQQARFERFKESYPGLDSDEFSEQDSEVEEFGVDTSTSREMAKLLGQIVQKP